MSFRLFQPEYPQRSGIVHVKKKYFQFFKWRIGVGVQWLECGHGLKHPTRTWMNAIYYIDIWYFTMSIYRNRK